MKLRNKLILTFARAALWLSARLPLERARGLGRWAGRRYWAMDSRGRRIAERNIALAYPDKSTEEQNALVLATLEETGALAAELGHLWALPWEQSRALMREVEGADAVKQALASGRGVIVLGPHLGNWEVLGLHLATLGDMVALFEPPKIAELDALIRTSRERSGGKLVPTNPRGLAALVKSVRNGGISGILPDQVPDNEAGGMNAPFMGVECATAALGCNLVKKSGAVAFMGAALRIPGGFRVRYVPAPEAIYSDDLLESLTAMNKAVEELLQGFEAQYQWQYKRFRRFPRGEINYYRDTKVPRKRFERLPPGLINSNPAKQAQSALGIEPGFSQDPGTNNRSPDNPENTP